MSHLAQEDELHYQCWRKYSDFSLPLLVKSSTTKLSTYIWHIENCNCLLSPFLRHIPSQPRLPNEDFYDANDLLTLPFRLGCCAFSASYIHQSSPITTICALCYVLSVDRHQVSYTPLRHVYRSKDDIPPKPL